MTVGNRQEDLIGSSVAISPDGSVALVGAPGYGTSKGTVRAYVWNPQAQKWDRMGTNDDDMAGAYEWGDQAGSAVAISQVSGPSGGSLYVALVGSPGLDDDSGTARAYTWNPGTSGWDRMGSDTDVLGTNTYGGMTGASVSLSFLDGSKTSLDGLVALVGAPVSRTIGIGTARAYAWNASAAAWYRLGSDDAEMAGLPQADEAGFSVALSRPQSSAEPLVALVGARAYEWRGTARAYRWDAAAWRWVREGGDDNAMAGTIGGADKAGTSVAISWDGSRALVGAPKYDLEKGVVGTYTCLDPPPVASLSCWSGPVIR